ncbi:hypothetical protein FKP32DRAFT_1462290 [Trametes sanguinea]|nr:hypothetical protein FKP32DRAFT_1462290 [Trametes sanguinea]
MHSTPSSALTSFPEAERITSARDANGPEMTSVLGKRANSHASDVSLAKHPRVEDSSLFRWLPQPHFRPSPTMLRTPWPTCNHEDGIKTSAIPIPPHTEVTVEEHLSDVFARVAWIVPVRGCPGWHAATPALVIAGHAAPESPRPAGTLPGAEVEKRGRTSVTWTERSLLEFWSFVQGLRDAGNLGPLSLAFNGIHSSSVAPSVNPSPSCEPSNCLCASADMTVRSSSNGRRGRESGDMLQQYDYIKIYHDARYTHALRNLLQAWHYKVDGTKHKPLKDAKLVLVDDRGKGLLVC